MTSLMDGAEALIQMLIHMLIQILPEGLTWTGGLFLALALMLALSFEFVNGFHDTANAVATVIYTQSLSPVLAVVWSGCWNLTGVLVSTGAVAFSIASLLPADLVAAGSGAGFAMVFAVLIAAMLWNLSTWYLGLPVSSSHTLIGAILGVGLADMLRTGGEWGEGINWLKAQQVGLSLLISPLIGFCGAGLLLLLLKWLLPQPHLYLAPKDNSPPSLWIRILLILTCTGVSFAHGSNDGQKGMGLIMLILVGLLPGIYALNLHLPAADLAQLSASTQQISLSMPLIQPMTRQQQTDQLSQFLKPTEPVPTTTVPSEISQEMPQEMPQDTLSALALTQQDIVRKLAEKTTLTQLSVAERSELRSELYLVSESLLKLERLHKLPLGLEPDRVRAYCQTLKATTQFIPVWVKVAVAVALGLGTMIGWKRIVVTVGEKIGTDPLTYGQGAAAELVAMGTILTADSVGLPVSTTQVLSSGVAGTMAANGSGIQSNTVKHILLAWVLTLPVCMLLSGGLFAVELVVVEKLELPQRLFW